MKKLFSLLIALSVCVSSFAQSSKTRAATRANPNAVPVPWVQTGQMLNIANAYSGTFYDTFTNAATKYLYTAIQGTPVAAADTFVPYPVYGEGMLVITCTGTKTSGSPTGTLSLEESPNSLNWGPCPDDIAPDDVDTLVPGNSTFAFTWRRSANGTPYKRVKIPQGGTAVTVWQCFYYLAPKTLVSLN